MSHELKLGIVADEISRDFRVAVRQGKEAGVERFEVRFLQTGRIPGCDPEEIERVSEIAQGEGITITAISPGLFKHATTEAEFRREMTDILPRAMELAQRWNAKMIVFGFQKPNATEKNIPVVVGEIPQEVVGWMREASERAQQANVQMLLEPEPICWADTGIRAAELIRRVACSSLRMNYDPGNVAWMTRRNPASEWTDIGDLVAHLHIKDVVLNHINGDFPKWVMPGQGGIGYAELFECLCGAEFAGDISMESHMQMSPELLVEFKTAVERLWQEASLRMAIAAGSAQ